jgi:hypothetical protein
MYFNIYHENTSHAPISNGSLIIVTQLEDTCRFCIDDVLFSLKETPWSGSVSELYRPSDRRLSAKLVPTFADRRSHVVSVMDPYSHIIGLLDQSRYFFFQVVPQLRLSGPHSRPTAFQNIW